MLQLLLRKQEMLWIAQFLPTCSRQSFSSTVIRWDYLTFCVVLSVWSFWSLSVCSCSVELMLRETGGVHSLETGYLKDWGEEEHLQRAHLIAAQCREVILWLQHRFPKRIVWRRPKKPSCDSENTFFSKGPV